MTNPASLAPRVANITRLYRLTTPEQRENSLAWYADAYKIADALAVKNGVTLDVAAGVIAALSPLNAWGHNINLAARFLATPGGLTSGYLPVNLAKARRILAGEPVESVLTSDKVGAFYAGIRAEGRTDIVCVDRHAWSLAVNFRYAEGNIPNLKGKRYAAATEAYQRAAVILSAEAGHRLWAAQVQSVTWMAWRRKFWAEGAWDSHDLAA